MELIWDHQVVDALADGYDVHYGARSLKYEVLYISFPFKKIIYIYSILI